MNRRQLQNKEKKKSVKNAIKREQNKNDKFFIFFMVVGVLNWIFWHDQYIGLDLKYNVVFVVLPFIIGFFLYFAVNKLFIKDLFQTKSTGLKDTVLSNGFLLMTALFFSYMSSVTVANAIFKLGMDFSTSSKSIVNKSYAVESTYRNDRGKGIHFFSNVNYFDEENKIKHFDVKVNAVNTSYQTRKIIFKCKEGFWGYYKIIDYRIE